MDCDKNRPGTSHSLPKQVLTRCTGALRTTAQEAELPLPDPCGTTLLPLPGPLNSPSGGQYMARLGVEPAPAACVGTQQTPRPPVLDPNISNQSNISHAKKIPDDANSVETEDPGIDEERSEKTQTLASESRSVETQGQQKRMVPYVLISPRRTRVDRTLVAMSDEPVTMSEAQSRKDAELWREAAKKELASIMANGTWDLVELPAGRLPIDSKWVFKIKRDAAGNIERYKARLVARGFMQQHGVDFAETFAPVAKFTSIRVLLAIAAAEDLELHQLDVDTAFLNGDLKEEIYMKQPLGFEEPGREHLVCRLKKSLYGLKQASRSWYEKIDGVFGELGLRSSGADHSIYYKLDATTKVYVALYVDDLIIATNSPSELNKLKHGLAERFAMKDLGELHFFLGIHIERNRAERSITLSQTSYIDDVLARFGMVDCRPTATPMDPGLILVAAEKEATTDEAKQMKAVPYLAAVGSLMYVMLGTRPDLAFAVGVVSRYSSDPRPEHWTAVKRILRYLKGTRDVVLRYIGGTTATPVGYSDSDWGSDRETRRSTTGYIFMISNAAVTWQSKRQPTVALSSTEAEYMAACQAAREAVWLRALLKDLGYPQHDATVLYGDNQGCLALAKNPTLHARTKHIEMRHHFIRERIESGEIRQVYCSTEDMVADGLTKALARDKHETSANAMGLVGIRRQANGSVGGFALGRSVVGS